MQHNLLVIIPYRDRENHLKIFIPYIHEALQKQNITYKLLIVEQKDNNLFNRGLLCNIGFRFLEAQCDYICIHDVDTIGEPFDYKYEPYVTHLSALYRKHNYKEWYARFLGGVTLFPKYLFFHINGFSNNYWGWGREDDDLKLRCDLMGIQTKRKLCKYYTLDHPTIPYHERPQKSPGFIQNKNRFDTFAKNRDIDLLLQDGISNVSELCYITDHSSHPDYDLLQVTT